MSSSGLPFHDDELNEMRQFAELLSDDLGPLFGRDVVRLLVEYRRLRDRYFLFERTRLREDARRSSLRSEIPVGRDVDRACKQEHRSTEQGVAQGSDRVDPPRFVDALNRETAIDDLVSVLMMVRDVDITGSHEDLIEKASEFAYRADAALTVWHNGGYDSPLDEPESKLRAPDHPRQPEACCDDRAHEKPHGAPGSSSGRVCKCGHDKSWHPYTGRIVSWPTRCQVCECVVYDPIEEANCAGDAGLGGDHGHGDPGADQRRGLAEGRDTAVEAVDPASDASRQDRQAGQAHVPDQALAPSKPRLFERLDEAGQFRGVDIEQTLCRVERNFHNEIAERGGEEVALRLVGRWLAGVEYREWTLLAEDRRTLLAEVARLSAEVYRLQGPM